jgi:hypothetical protein
LFAAEARKIERKTPDPSLQEIRLAVERMTGARRRERKEGRWQKAGKAKEGTPRTKLGRLVSEV